MRHGFSGRAGADEAEAMLLFARPREMRVGVPGAVPGGCATPGRLMAERRREQSSARGIRQAGNGALCGMAGRSGGGRKGVGQAAGRQKKDPGRAVDDNRAETGTPHRTAPHWPALIRRPPSETHWPCLFFPPGCLLVIRAAAASASLSLILFLRARPGCLCQRAGGAAAPCTLSPQPARRHAQERACKFACVCVCV